MNHPEKQLKYSIRKVSVGAASVVIGAFYFAMGAGVVHAETNATTEGGTSHSSPSPESNTNNPNSLPGSNYQAEPAPNPATLLAGVAHSVKEETETKTVTRTIKYVNANDESKEVSTTVTQTVTLTRKLGTNEWTTTGKWEAQSSPTVDGYGVPDKLTVEAKDVTATTEDEEVLVYYKQNSSSNTGTTTNTEATSARGRRTRRALEDGSTGGTTEGTSDTSTETTGTKKETAVDPKRKGETVQENHPGVNVPNKDEEGGDDPNAHLTFNNPGEDATVEEMWKIIQNMPDDFQNNERSYLRNMDTLGDNLRFDQNGNVTDDPNGAKLQPGEIREISSFGGWTAIMKKDGETGKFAIGMKNAQGYFTGWYNKNGVRQEGGMLGSNALDQIFLHEQALDRRFKYMLMLAKGRTIANKDDEAQDGSKFKIETPNNTENKANLAHLPVKDREDILQHAPNLVGFNGIEKTFKAFSKEYGSRLKIDFVTGYISDFEGSKGTYRIVVKAIKKDNTEETIYDHTINRIDGVVENEERYSQGVDLSGINNFLKTELKREYNAKVEELAKERYKEGHPTIRNPKLREYKHLMPIIEKELAEKGETTIELPVDKVKLNDKNFQRETKFKFNTSRYANNLNNIIKKITDEEVLKNSPAWGNATDKNSDGTTKSTDPDRLYKLLDFVLPTAKKIIYHADTDQLELETDPEKVEKHRADLKSRLEAKEALLKTTTEETETNKLKKEISALKSAIGSTNSYTYTEARNGKVAKILGSHMEASEQPDPSELPEEIYNKIRTNKLALGEQEGFERFTKYFVEKERINRSNVLPDAELSKKITEAIGGDNEKLGKGGYFSTGDIRLDKDVVAYKIQVFAENEKRVGVNKQSPRLQYNLPILADFSVIQDTVESSREVARRIITKLKEKGKITEEEEKRIEEELKKKKKTSEVRSLLSANVKVKYVDKQGNALNIKDDSKFGKKDSDNTYLVKKDVLLTNEYDVSSSKRTIIEGANDKYYKLVAANDGLLANSAPVKGEIDSVDDKVVTFVYEETEKPKVAKATVTIRNENNEALAEFPDLHLESIPNTEFPSDSVTSTVEKLKTAGYTITTNTFDTTSKVADDIDDSTTVSQTYTIIVTKQKPQTIEIKFVDVTDGRNKEVKKYSFTGKTNDSLTTDNIKDVEKTLTKLKERGYVIENIPALKTIVYDNKDDGTTPSQIYKINIREPKVVNTETREVTRTIHYVFKDGTKAHDDVVQKATFERTLTTNMVTALTDYGEWSGNGSLAEVVSPEIEHHSVNTERITAVEVTGKSDNTEVTVTYTPKLPTPPTVVIPEAKIGKAVVHFKKKVSDTETEALNDYPDMPLAGEVGGKFPSDEVDAQITKLKKAGYEIVGDTFTSAEKTVDDKEDTEGETPTQEYTITVKERVADEVETKTITRTINYVDEAGNKLSEPSTDRVTFTREAKINVVTGEITYGDWKAVGGDSTFDKVSSPVVKGYILKDPAQKEVAERKGITPTVANQTIEVVYKKLGSWVPKVPGVETPTPLPYPNDPTDPTKPGDPTDPNTPNVPVIPYVPGYTPKIGETPLQPKVPNDPTKGYIPPVPTEPGKDTPIEYVKVPNTPSPEEPTPESNHITIWVDENGKPLKPEKPGTHEPGNIPGYRYITTVTKDGVTIHKFEKITPVDPNNPVPQKPTTSIPTPQDSTIPTPESQIPTPNTPEANTPTSETNRREELPNTGTEANATLASAGIMTLLAGLGLGFFKKKEEDEK